MRVENWESKLEQVIEKTKKKPDFKYGKNDCITFTLECIEAITGKKVFDRKWKSLKHGKEIIKKLKKKDLLDIALHIAKENNFEEIIINKAQRGDVMYYKDEFDWDGTLGVCIGEKTMFNWKKAIMVVNNNKCLKCWRIN
jgi:hypothetical protein